MGKKLIVGNWKMNGLVADGLKRASDIAAAAKAGLSGQMVLCPPATLIGAVSAVLQGSGIATGGQDCHDKPSGAYTGNISAPMLKDIGCAYVILGHSERRLYERETDNQIAAKAQAAHAAGLIAIICVGESDAERSSGKAGEIVSRQLQGSIPEGASEKNTVIAYEPVWAIGTGKVASTADIADMHALIRTKAGVLPILYGGSVKADNAQEILRIANVDGVLVGGASLKAEDFIAIAKAAP